AEVHWTAPSSLPSADVGLGVAWIAQVVPFHRSATGACPVLLFTYCPTASHDFAEVQETACSARELPSAGVGVACADQEWPFHRSACLPAGPNPVTSQEPGEVQETELRNVNPAAVARSDQEVPFQAATWPSNPAARQNFAEVHDTAVSWPPG